MQVVTNQEFVNARTRIGRWGTLAGAVGMGAGFITSFNVEYIAASYIFLIFGILSFNVGRYNAMRWGIHPREDEILTNSLKGLDQKYALINYAPGVPSAHVILSPFGLIHVETRHVEGVVVCEGDRWRRKRSFLAWLRGFAEGQLGNPTKSALATVDRLRAFLVENLGADIAGQVPVEAVVVFVNPRVDLNVSDAVVPSMTPRELKAHVRTPSGRTKVPPEAFRKAQQLLIYENGLNGKNSYSRRKVG